MFLHALHAQLALTTTGKLCSPPSGRAGETQGQAELSETTVLENYFAPINHYPPSGDGGGPPWLTSLTWS